MATDLTLYLDDQPGELARIGDVLGKAGANIAGLCALTSGGGQAEVHILVHEATVAFEALRACRNQDRRRAGGAGAENRGPARRAR